MHINWLLESPLNISLLQSISLNPELCQWGGFLGLFLCFWGREGIGWGIFFFLFVVVCFGLVFCVFLGFWFVLDFFFVFVGFFGGKINV